MGRKLTALTILWGLILTASFLGSTIQVRGVEKKATITVPDDYPTIQTAVNASSSGDTVFVRNGTYVENVVIIDKWDFTIEAESIDTIVDGNGSTVFWLKNGGFTISGFTIVNGDYGIFSERPRVVVNRCVIENCSIGIAADDEFVVNGTILRKCQQALIGSTSDIPAQIVDCEVYDCESGLFVASAGSHGEAGIVTLHNNSIYSNGDALTLVGTQGVVENNLFNDNDCAITLGEYSHIFVQNNIICTSTYSGIVLASFRASHSITDNYIAGNGHGITLKPTPDGDNRIANNTFYRNNFGVYVTEFGWSEWELSTEVYFHRNNFLDNIIQVFYETDEAIYHWNESYPSGGNYWSDYNGSDLYTGDYQNISGPDGFGDTPFIIDPLRQDSYPFVDQLVLPLPPLPSFSPTSRFSFEPLNPVVNGTIVFNASASNDIEGEIVSYYWGFGDGTIVNGTDSILTHFYHSVNNYNVTLTVTDNDEQNDTITKVVNVGKMSSTISISADPFSITIRENATISGIINPTRADVDVTIWHKHEENVSWSILANVTTELSGEYSYNWTPTITGAYALRASWPGDEHTFQNESTTIDFVCSNISSTISISTSCASTYVGFRVNATGTLKDMYGDNLVGETVVLYYTFQGISTWTPITSDQTDGSGNYFAVWIPPATGDFIIKAEWAGNATHSTINNTISLNSLPYNNQYVFSVESNSTVSSLEFDAADLELKFDVTGLPGTFGYIRVTIAKTLISNIEKLEVKLNDEEVEYTIMELDDSWLISMTYSHSTHQISVDLNIDIIPEFPFSLLLPLLMLGTLLAALVFRKRSKV